MDQGIPKLAFTDYVEIVEVIDPDPSPAVDDVAVWRNYIVLRYIVRECRADGNPKWRNWACKPNFLNYHLHEIVEDPGPTHLWEKAWDELCEMGLIVKDVDGVEAGVWFHITERGLNILSGSVEVLK